MILYKRNAKGDPILWKKEKANDEYKVSYGAVCGHIHEAKSLSKIGFTTDVANPGMLKDNGAVLVDIKDGSNYDISIISLDE